MLEQAHAALTFFCHYTDLAGNGSTGLTVTCSVFSPTGTLLVDAGSATEIGRGLYRYTLSGASTAANGGYAAVFHTTSTAVAQRDLPALWIVGAAGVGHLDADISTRLAAEDYATPPSADAIATAVRAALTAELALLDVAVSTRLAAEDYATPPSADAIAAAVRAALIAELALLDVAVSTRLAADDYGAASNPLAVVLSEGLYPDHSVGEILRRQDIGPPDMPTLVLPAPPGADKGKLCLWTEDFVGARRAGIKLIAELSSYPASAGGRVLETTPIEALTDAEGYAELILPASSAITPANTRWLISAPALGIRHVRVALPVTAINLKDFI